MADVQLEHGYVRIAHELLRAILRAKLSEREKAVILSVVDRTYGEKHSPKMAPISMSAIAHDTGIDRTNVAHLVSNLAAANVLIRERRGRSTTLLGLQKDHDLWRCSRRDPPAKRDKPTIGRVVCTDNTAKSGRVVCTDNTSADRGVVATDNRVEIGRVVCTDNLTKTETKSKDPPPVIPPALEAEQTALELESPPAPPPATDDAFGAFWAAYPRKVSKAQARRTFAKLNPDAGLQAEILAGLERAKALDSRFRDPDYTPHASTWLNAEGWTDEHAPPRPPMNGAPRAESTVDRMQREMGYSFDALFETPGGSRERH